MSDPTDLPDDGSEDPYAPPLSDASVPIPPTKISVPLLLGLLLVVVVAFLLNIGLGIGVLLLAVPAYARAVGVSAQKAAGGQANSTNDRVLAFLGSIGVVIACTVAGAIAFFATCTGSLFVWGPLERVFGGSVVGWFLMALCCVGFLVAAGFLYRVCWPRRAR